MIIMAKTLDVETLYRRFSTFAAADKFLKSFPTPVLRSQNNVDLETAILRTCVVAKLINCIKVAEEWNRHEYIRTRQSVVKQVNEGDKWMTIMCKGTTGLRMSAFMT